MAFGKSKEPRPVKFSAEAQELRRQGATVYTPKLSSSSKEWGDIISAIESAGWTLEHWSVWANGNLMDADAYPVFRAR
ncbi:hypothetical protein QSJ19_19645 [Gordonia sp. ABSL11-1]|uniref:hypothetical protein n=1 Tax=Gordonia sp. ABSL11-1 TaxID=3053924 RepID=UPI0025743C62|nr:hypothetical protein [Gordonia sp. ABSL11-1]MDL9947755.1 hypothetical protein [Gordonia sp. ABSL11-1]